MALDAVWILVCAGLVFLMQAGFMCLESGLTRSKNSINVAVKNLADFVLSASLFWAVGYGVMFGTSLGGWVGHDLFFVGGEGSAIAIAIFLFQTMFCGTATTIVSGATAERLQFAGYLAIAALLSGVVYPLFGHWAWNEAGWLRQLGFVDFAGSTVVHSIGAWAGLATLLVLGPRQGRFGSRADRGDDQPVQGSNMPFSVLGAMLLWFGWFGFNGGSFLVLNDRVPAVVLNTLLAGLFGAVVGGVLSIRRDQSVPVEGMINGLLAGLVAVTAGCHALSAPLAAIVGGTGAAAAMLVSWALVRWRVDDAVDAVAVHGGAGVWGTLALALFGDLDRLETGLGRFGQLAVQGLGVAIALGLSLGGMWGVLVLLDRVWPLRVSAEAETLGLNVSEHGAKTETYDLFQVLDTQARTGDLSLRVPVDAFTEAGHIATRYNQVLDNLEQQHRDVVYTLDDLAVLAAATQAAVESRRFAPEAFDLGDLAERPDEIGQLARSIHELLAIAADQAAILEGRGDGDRGDGEVKPTPIAPPSP